VKPTLRCSELDRSIECPGSLTIVPLVTPRVGDEGIDGTRLHALGARMLISNYGATGPTELSGPHLPTIGYLSLSDWVARYYVDVVSEIVPPNWSMEVEGYFAYDMGCCFLTGHPDCFAINPEVTEAVGFDLKAGYIPVEIAERNWQMLGYVVLLLLAFPTLRKVTWYIIQPRNDVEEGFPRISSVTIEDERLDNAIAYLTAKIADALSRQMELNSGRVQCKWCDAAGPQCPCTSKLLDFMRYTMTPQEVAKIHKEPDDAKLGDWIIGMKTLDRPTKDLTDLLHKRLDTQTEIIAGDGTRITRTIENGSYSVPDLAKFWDAVEGMVTDKYQMARAVDWSMGKLKAVIAEVFNCPKTGKAELTAEGIFDAKLRPLVEQGKRRKLNFS